MPSRERCGRQLSRKECLDGREQDLQVLENTRSFISIFPEETSSRESSLFLTFSHRSALTVGFGFVAAANPSRVLGNPLGPLNRHLQTLKGCLHPLGQGRRPSRNLGYWVVGDG